MNDYTLRQIADALNVSQQAVQKRSKKEGWPFTEAKGRGGMRRIFSASTLPESVQTAIALKEIRDGKTIAPEQPIAKPKSFTYCSDSLWDHYASKTSAQKNKAETRQLLLLQAAQLVDAGKSTWLDAFKAVANANGNVSWQTLRDTYHGKPGKPGIKQYDRKDWLAALVPQHKGRTASAELCTDAWLYIKADYLRNEKPTLNACYERLQFAAAENGWTVPSCKTVERRIKSLPLATRTFLREGEHALMRLFPPMERSVRDLHAMEWINGDGYQHNVFIKWPNGEIRRPKTWFWQDIYSRKIIGWRTDISENSDMIRLSFGDVVEEYGIPDHITIDNTRAAANKWMTGGVANRYRFKVKEDDPMGIWPQLGIQVHWTSVIGGHGHGQAKPIERAFGVGGLEEYIDKHPALAGCYTGANPMAKPENYGSAAIELDKFIGIIEQGVSMYNAKTKRRTELCAQIHSFNDVFESSYANALVRKGSAEQRRLWLLAAEAIKVSKQGTIRLEAGAIRGTNKAFNRYGADFLLELRDQKIVVRFDPDQLHENVHCYTIDGRYIGQADCLEAHGFGDTQSGRSHTRERTRFIKASKIAAKAEEAMGALEAAQLLPELDQPEPPESKVVRPVFGEQKRVVGSDINYQPTDEQDLVGSSEDLVLQLWNAQKAQEIE